MKPSKHTDPVHVWTRGDMVYLMGACLFLGMTLGLLIAPIISA